MYLSLDTFALWVTWTNSFSWAGRLVWLCSGKYRKTKSKFSPNVWVINGWHSKGTLGLFAPATLTEHKDYIIFLLIFLEVEPRLAWHSGSSYLDIWSHWYLMAVWPLVCYWTFLKLIFWTFKMKWGNVTLFGGLGIIWENRWESHSLLA